MSRASRRVRKAVRAESRRLSRAGELMLRSWPSMIAGLAAVVLLVALAFQGGGYFPSAFARSGAMALIVLAGLLLLKPPHYRLSRQALFAAGGLAALAAWTGISARWSPVPDTAVADMQRVILYLAIFALGLLAAGSGRLVRSVGSMILIGIGIVIASALISRVDPGVFEIVEGELDLTYRLNFPLGYANALGALAAMGGVLGLGLAADVARAAPMRGLAAAIAVLAAVAAFASVSRGALLAAGVGLGVLILIAPRRGALLVSTAIAAACAAGAIYSLQKFPGLLDDPTAGYGRVVEGQAFAPTLVAAAVAAGVVQAAVAAIRLRTVAVANLGRVGRPLALGLGVAVLAGAVALYAVKGDRIEGESASRLGSVESFLDRQVDEFLSPSLIARQGTDRLADASGSRSDLYRVALGGFAERPLTGGGGGSFEPLYYERRSLDVGTRDAHSLYLETLSELGIVGFAALALFLGAFGFAAARALQSGRTDRGTAAAAVAAVMVLLAHSAVDWDWQVPALTGFGLLLAALVFPIPRARSREAREPLVLAGAE